MLEDLKIPTFSVMVDSEFIKLSNYKIKLSYTNISNLDIFK